MYVLTINLKGLEVRHVDVESRHHSQDAQERDEALLRADIAVLCNELHALRRELREHHDP